MIPRSHHLVALALDHPFGVWTLPPSGNSAPNGQPANPAIDRANYDAIGESDRMTLRFRKPA